MQINFGAIRDELLKITIAAQNLAAELPYEISRAISVAQDAAEGIVEHVDPLSKIQALLGAATAKDGALQPAIESAKTAVAQIVDPNAPAPVPAVEQEHNTESDEAN